MQCPACGSTEIWEKEYCATCKTQFNIFCPICLCSNPINVDYCYSCNHSLHGIHPVLFNKKKENICPKCKTHAIWTLAEGPEAVITFIRCEKCRKSISYAYHSNKWLQNASPASQTVPAIASNNTPQEVQLGIDTQTHTPVFLPENERTYHTVIIGHADGQDVKLSYDKRTQGIAVIGKTGTGKSSLVHAIINQELQGRDCTVILFDPHGELTDTLLHTAATQSKSLFIVTPDPTQPFGLNLLEANPQDIPAVERTIDVTIQIFKKLLGSDYTFMPRFEYIMGNAARTLIYANTGYTLAEIPLILTDEQFRRNVIKNSINPQVVQFWREYEIIAKREYERIQYIESAANRLNTLLANDLLYRIVSQSKSTIRFTDLLESGRVIMFSLPMGKLGEGATSLLGSIMLAKCAEVLYSRGTGKKRVHLYIDEYGRFFATPFTADLLTQGRKYNVSTLVTMQTLQGMEETSKAAVLNAGNTIAFQLIPKDAEELAGIFPVSLVQQEAARPSYSLHAVDDLLREGSPDQTVQTITTVVLDIFDQMDCYPRQEFFEYPYNGFPWRRIHHKLSTADFSWADEFFDGKYYISSRYELMRAKEALNKYLYLWQTLNIDTDEIPKLYLFIVVGLMGYFGIYPKWQKGKIVPAGPRFSRSLLEQNTGIPGEHPQWIIQIDEDHAWKYTKFPMPEDEIFPAIGDLYQAIAQEQGQRVPQLFANLQKESFETYLAVRSKTVENEYNGRTEKQWDFVLSRIQAEGKNFVSLATALYLLGVGVANNPLQIKSRFYPSPDNRTIADLKNEISSTLATLPLYTAMCQLRRDDNTNWAGIVKLIKG